MPAVFLALMLSRPNCLSAQIVIELNHNQPPELQIESLPDLTFSGDPVQLGTPEMVQGGSGDYIYHWVPETGLDDPSIARPLASPDADVSYALTITDGHGCSVVSIQHITVDLTSVNSHYDSPFLKVYPNPGNGNIRLEMQGIAPQQSRIWITNMLGEIIHETGNKQIGGDQYVDMSISTPPGLYVLFLGTENATYQTPIIIQ
jgi:hypothetical protein